MSKWIKNNKASVCNWDLTVRFLIKEQMNEFVKMLIDAELDYNFEYERKDNDGPYELTIYNFHWAKNIIAVGEMLEKVDHDMS